MSAVSAAKCCESDFPDIVFDFVFARRTLRPVKEGSCSDREAGIDRSYSAVLLARLCAIEHAQSRQCAGAVEVSAPDAGAKSHRPQIRVFNFAQSLVGKSALLTCLRVSVV
jgi:hypothetical protein